MKILLFLLFSIILLADNTSIFHPQTQTKPQGPSDKSLCKLFTDKARTYEKNMRDDDYAKVTLRSYKHRAAIYCKTK
jgi:hypothetical protein